MSRSKNHTAWSLAGDWWWTEDYFARIVGGIKLWETVTAPRGGISKTVRIWRFENHRSHIQYVEPMTKMELVKKCTRTT